MRSALYVGKVGHNRLSPRRHSFTYDVFMMCVDLDEIDTVCKRSFFWTQGRRFWSATFCRKDYHGSPDVPLKKSVQETIFNQLGVCHDGPILMLANWRYFGFNMNPLVVYYCYEEGDGISVANPKYIVAEVSNTPWNKRHAYVNECDPTKATQSFEFDKKMHVSPFNSMDMAYHWRSTTPGDTLEISLENWTAEGKIFSALMQLKALPVTARNLRRILIFYPFMTVKVIIAIYWQAFKLLLKKVPVYSNPA